MAKATIPISATLVRVDGSAMMLSELKELDVSYSLDAGANFTRVGTFPANATSFSIDGLDPGSDVLVQATETDTQLPPAVSAPATISFSIPAVKPAPMPPTLGTPVIS